MKQGKEGNACTPTTSRKSRSLKKTWASSRLKRALRCSSRDARREIWRLPTRDAWRVDDGHAPSARGAQPFRGCPLHGALRLPYGDGRRARDVLLPFDDVLLVVLT